MGEYLDTNFDPAKLVDVFDELPFWSAPFGIQLLEHINYLPGIHALDIGFGTGFPLTELAMRLGHGSKVYGIDPWKEAIEKVKKKLAYYQITNVEIIEGLAESIPLQDESIDLIVSNNGLNNVNDFNQAVSECARVLKPDGQFIQTMNLDQSMHEFYEIFKEVLFDFNLLDEVEKVKAHIYEKRKPLQETIHVLEQHGFKMRATHFDLFRYRFASGSAMLNHYFIRLAFLPSWKKVLPEDITKDIFVEVEKRLNKTTSNGSGLALSIPFVVLDAVKIEGTHKKIILPP